MVNKSTTLPSENPGVARWMMPALGAEKCERSRVRVAAETCIVHFAARWMFSGVHSPSSGCLNRKISAAFFSQPFGLRVQAINGMVMSGKCGPVRLKLPDCPVQYKPAS